MNKLILILLLSTISLSAQVGTGNITLEEVMEEMWKGDNHYSLSLLNCISYANINGNWDAAYLGDKNSLLNFRGYFKSIETITISSTSTSSSWSPQASVIVAGGGDLDWSVTGAVTIPKITVNDPVFDFSVLGVKNILIEKTNSLYQLLSIICKSRNWT